LCQANGLLGLAERRAHSIDKGCIRLSGVAQARHERADIAQFTDVQHGVSRLQATAEGFGRLSKLAKTSFENEVRL
jgi:hypothetical protein